MTFCAVVPAVTKEHVLRVDLKEHVFFEAEAKVL